MANQPVATSVLMGHRIIVPSQRSIRTVSKNANLMTISPL